MVDVRTASDRDVQAVSGQASTFDGEAPGEFLYFFHRDHLGSTSYVTDEDGAVYEHVQYFPFGETWVQEGQPEHRVPYLFTSKELDDETGLYYFGARYYDPRTSGWVSTDPALEKFLPSLADRIGAERQAEPYRPERSLPGMGGVYRPTNLALYAYSSLNPVRWYDPNGMWSFAPEYGDSSQGLQPVVLKIEGTVDAAFQKVAGRDAIITFATSGEHKVGSRHYSGLAVDLRTRDLSLEQKTAVSEMLQVEFGEDFDVITESTHIHLEYDPKTSGQANEQPGRSSASPYNANSIPSSITEDDTMEAFRKFGQHTE